MKGVEAMQEQFYGIADYANSLLKDGEVINLLFEGEKSEFVRFNHNKVRQPGSVTSSEIGIDLMRGMVHAEASQTLTGIDADDKAMVRTMIERLRERLDFLPEDPHLLYATEVNSTEKNGISMLPKREDAVNAIIESAGDKDMVGIYAQGPIFRGFANSFGQKNWFSSNSYHFDWSFYLRADKAVKSSYAGFEWDESALNRKMAGAAVQFDLLKKEPKTIPAGKYRVYLSPSAVEEIIGILAWYGFGLKNHKSKIASLLKMTEGDSTVHPSFNLWENTGDGIAPNFDAKGFIKPDRVEIIKKGKFNDYLVSPRSAKEYDVPTNAAGAGEFPDSLDLGPGKIEAGDVLKELGTGCLINNLWYLNYSDRPACRITGMTRFATFWVEDGQIVAPLNVMRFDESFYRAFGENLLGLTKDREMLLSAQTYGGRDVSSSRLPGALIKDFEFTL
jgi:predicted Zn-dependent protease